MNTRARRERRKRRTGRPGNRVCDRMDGDPKNATRPERGQNHARPERVLESCSVRNSIVTEGFELPSLERIVRIVQAARFLVDRCCAIRGNGLESDSK